MNNIFNAFAVRPGPIFYDIDGGNGSVCKGDFSELARFVFFVEDAQCVPGRAALFADFKFDFFFHAGSPILESLNPTGFSPHSKQVIRLVCQIYNVSGG